MSDDIQKTALRLPRGLHEAIHKAAKESGRTMNAEIVYRLQQSFEHEDDDDSLTYDDISDSDLSGEFDPSRVLKFIQATEANLRDLKLVIKESKK